MPTMNYLDLIDSFEHDAVAAATPSNENLEERYDSNHADVAAVVGAAAVVVLGDVDRVAVVHAAVVYGDVVHGAVVHGDAVS